MELMLFRVSPNSSLSIVEIHHKRRRQIYKKIQLDPSSNATGHILRVSVKAMNNKLVEKDLFRSDLKFECHLDF